MRSDLPSGTVTFLFTDIEGSTRLLHSLGAQGYADALAEHRRVIREARAAEGGVEVDTQGDAFFFAFPTAPGALAAASALHANDRGSWQLSQWLQWLHSAFARVRWGSLARAEAAANRPFERTGANGRERPPTLAMQKVEGSSPFIPL
jgi:class 3 adenylate cyclase